MNSPFVRRDGRLFAEDVALADVAAAAGTPVYVYSATALVQRWEALHRSFAQVPHRICYSLKANMNLAVVRTLVARGAGADVTSGGELFRALRAGTPPAHIVYSGVGKTEPEIDRALEVGIELFNAESRAELRRIDAVAGRRGARAPIAFRVNPEVDPHTHPYVATGLRTSKFGVPIAEALEAYAEAKALGHVEVVGVHCHIGSQLTRIGPFADALARIRTLVLDLRETGHDIRILDVGGGLGVRYEHEDPPSAEAYAEAVLDAVGDLGCELVLEPGRWLTAEATICCVPLSTEGTTTWSRSGHRAAPSSRWISWGRSASRGISSPRTVRFPSSRRGTCSQSTRREPTDSPWHGTTMGDCEPPKCWSATDSSRWYASGKPLRIWCEASRSRRN
jgi:diaminopimelate decarboxylase